MKTQLTLCVSSKLSDVFTTLSVLSDSLLTGRPLPACLPRLRDRLLYHEYHAGRRGLPVVDHSNESDSDEVQDGGSSAAEEEELDYSAGKVDGSSIGFEELTLDLLMVRCFVLPYLWFNGTFAFLFLFFFLPPLA